MTVPRLPSPPPDQLDPAQRTLYDLITGGPRGTGSEIRDEHGALRGPFGLMVHTPQVGTPLQELGATLRFATTMADRVREIAILAVATVTGSTFEWYAHERIGRAAGLTDQELAGLRAGTFTSADPVEQAAHTLCTRVAATGDAALPDDEYRSMVAALGGEQLLLELVILAGYYRILAQMMAVFAVGAPR